MSDESTFKRQHDKDARIPVRLNAVLPVGQRPTFCAGSTFCAKLRNPKGDLHDAEGSLVTGPGKLQFRRWG